MINKVLLSILRCPKSGTSFEYHSDYLYCPDCGDKYYYNLKDDYINMSPPGADKRESVYGSEEFIKKKDLLTPGPPFLSGGLKNWVLKRMVLFKKYERVLDAGCGPGRYMLWNQSSGTEFVGIDQQPYYAPAVIKNTPLVQGFLHHMPFAPHSFDYIICLDVLEHMALDDIKSFLKAASKILKKRGKIFIYTNSVESSALAPVIRFRQRITAFFSKRGIVDLTIEKESKEDHMNVIKTRSQLVEIAKEYGLALVDSAFYNPVIMGWFENLFLKIAENRVNCRLRGKKIHKSYNTSTAIPAEGRKAKCLIKEKTKRKGFVYFIFWLITQIMKLDIFLFSSVESGQFFLLFEKREQPQDKM